MEAGGVAYVAKRDLVADLVPAIRAALRGRRFLSASIDSPETYESLRGSNR
jgi:DNA-binding NarL/FixJ family response regulator